MLIALSPLDDVGGLEDVRGAVITDPSAGLPDLSGKAVHLCGDVSKAEGLDLSAAARVQVIRERSHGYGRPTKASCRGDERLDADDVG